MTPTDTDYRIQQALLQLAEAQTRAAEAATRSFVAIAELASAQAIYVKVASDRQPVNLRIELAGGTLDQLMRLITAKQENGAKRAKPARRK